MSKKATAAELYLFATSGKVGRMSIDAQPHNLANSEVVVKRLRSVLPGKNLYELAELHGITVYKAGLRNKGWVGQTIERVADLPISNAPSRDGLDFELKSTVLLQRGDQWTPKETIKVTSLNPKKILDETFETSALWNKLSLLLIVGYYNESPTR